MEATAGSASSSHGWLASSGHQQVALGTQWPFNSQKEGLADGVWESLGQEAGFGAHFQSPSRWRPSAWAPWGRGPGGPEWGSSGSRPFRGVVLWSVSRHPQGVLHLLILNNDGVKARGTGNCLGSNWHEASPGLNSGPFPSLTHSLTHAHTECTEYFLCCWAKPGELRMHLRGHLVPSSSLSFLLSSFLSFSPSPLPSCLSFSCPLSLSPFLPLSSILPL